MSSGPSRFLATGVAYTFYLVAASVADRACWGCSSSGRPRRRMGRALPAAALVCAAGRRRGPGVVSERSSISGGLVDLAAA